MRGVFTRVGRITFALSLTTVLLTHAVLADGRSKDGDRNPLRYFERAKHWVIEILGRIGGPPGTPEPSDGGES